MGFDRTVGSSLGWPSFFSSAGNCKRVRTIVAVVFFSQWSGNALVSYYLNNQHRRTHNPRQLPSFCHTPHGPLTMCVCGLQLSSTAPSAYGTSVARRWSHAAPTSAKLLTLFFTMRTVCFAHSRINADVHAALIWGSLLSR
ncbi:hypothetical protein B0H15DRAFT_949677 [Mycena belliarum]|uniref:Uncharacterized protein n=1 Tax=Mycena belliarum TaxID=1033014 RepID=A0AAD6U4S7_9AGAR|nr:hypothetical protein B0H15DRAFT_949677 [Mycena belliae]